MLVGRSGGHRAGLTESHRVRAGQPGITDSVLSDDDLKRTASGNDAHLLRQNECAKDVYAVTDHRIATDLEIRYTKMRIQRAASATFYIPDVA